MPRKCSRGRFPAIPDPRWCFDSCSRTTRISYSENCRMNSTYSSRLSMSDNGMRYGDPAQVQWPDDVQNLGSRQYLLACERSLQIEANTNTAFARTGPARLPANDGLHHGPRKQKNGEELPGDTGGNSASGDGVWRDCPVSPAGPSICPIGRWTCRPSSPSFASNSRAIAAAGRCVGYLNGARSWTTTEVSLLSLEHRPGFSSFDACES